MYRILFLISMLVLLGCNKNNDTQKQPSEDVKTQEQPQENPIEQPLQLTLEQANTLVELPLACLQVEYPNKLGQTLGGKENIGEPHVLHPTFYGCFDWHSSVHGHWSLVKLLKAFPDLEKKGRSKNQITSKYV